MSDVHDCTGIYGPGCDTCADIQLCAARGVSPWEVKILTAMQEAEQKAWKSLAGYKFYMFGYWAGAWVKYNNLLPRARPNPFHDAVTIGVLKNGDCKFKIERTDLPESFKV